MYTSVRNVTNSQITRSRSQVKGRTPQVVGPQVTHRKGVREGSFIPNEDRLASKILEFRDIRSNGLLSLTVKTEVFDRVGALEFNLSKVPF